MPIASFMHRLGVATKALYEILLVVGAWLALVGSACASMVAFSAGTYADADWTVVNSIQYFATLSGIGLGLLAVGYRRHRGSKFTSRKENWRCRTICRTGFNLANTRFGQRARERFHIMKNALGLLAFVTSAVAAPALASVITVDPTERGFITQNGVTNPAGSSIPPNEADYLLGNCAFASCSGSGGGEYRDFFSFAIPVISATIVSLDLVISTEFVTLAQSPLLTALFTSLNTTSSFAALGTGTFYGTGSYTTAEAFGTQTISLSASAISALLADQGGQFMIGARDESATDFGPSFANQWIFGHSGPGDLTQLVITTEDVASVPEPATLGLLGLCLPGVWAARRMRTARGPAIA